MPTYDYFCNECEKLFEIFHSIKDEPRKICPECQKESLKRMISSGTGFILKGGGWYSDLYSSKKEKKK
jgi:putative FmdB family regulatory protein